MTTIILLILSGIFNACMDVLTTRYSRSIFIKFPFQKWINPTLSYVNKWKPKSKIGDLIMSTIFVWLTDFWHNLKFLMLVCLSLSVSINYAPYGLFLSTFGYYCAITVTFEIFYSKILVYENKKIK